MGTFSYNLRFPGQYYDPETGLHYNYFRDYDPATGRYVQSDPIGLAAGMNTYAYSGGDPLDFADPTGLTSLTIPLSAPRIPAPPPVVVAAAVGVAVGTFVNFGFESLFGDSIGGALHDATHSDPMQMAAPGRQVDSAIEERVGRIQSAAVLAGLKRPDRCDVLEQMIRDKEVTAQAAKSTQKAWGCRPSRPSKDSIKPTCG